MIHYHGTPITPTSAAAAILAGRHGMVSFAHPDQLQLVADVCQSFVLDNGAFSAWRQGAPVEDWQLFWAWVQEWSLHPGFRWALIPDVIDGSEGENDRLITEAPSALRPWLVPVWHLHEGIARLECLASEWPRVALGSSGNYATPGSTNWWVRMHRALEAICFSGHPRCHLHGLRMLNPSIFSRLPLASADSCNIARNIGIDKAWKGTYAPSSKAWRGVVIAERIEAQQSAAEWLGEHQLELAISQGET